MRRESKLLYILDQEWEEAIIMDAVASKTILLLQQLDEWEHAIIMDEEREHAIIMDEEREHARYYNRWGERASNYNGWGAIVIITINGWGERRSYYNGWSREKKTIKIKNNGWGERTSCIIMDEERIQAIIMEEGREEAIIVIKINGWGERRSCFNGWRSVKKLLLLKEIMDEEREELLQLLQEWENAVIMDVEREQAAIIDKEREQAIIMVEERGKAITIKNNGLSLRGLMSHICDISPLCGSPSVPTYTKLSK